jgi:hypothetical protein
MRKFSLVAVTAVAVAALGTTLPAQGHGGGKGPKAPGGSTHAPKTPGAGTHAPKAGGKSSHGPDTKDDAPGRGKTAKTNDDGSTRDHAKKAKTSSASSDKSKGPGREPNAVAANISKNPNRLARVTGMLPAGMSIEEASAGFRNQGQFIAALNTSKNHQIDFVRLKEAMTVDGLSLGQAAKQLRPAPESAAAGGTAVSGTFDRPTTSTGQDE